MTNKPKIGENSSTTNPWGFSVKGVRPEGTCPICKKRFEWDKRKGYLCKKHRTTPQRYTIDFYNKGERIRRGTDLNGKTIRTFADAHALLNQVFNEKLAHKFDPTKWKSKDRIEFRFSTLIWKWYEEKEKLMEQGKRAPSYVPKLKTYIRHYYEPHFMHQDVREILSCKDFANKLPDMGVRVNKPPISLKYQKNLLDALKGFFIWLKDERIITDVPKIPVFEVPEYEPQIIASEIQHKILDFIPNEHKPIFTFLFHQGARPGEVTALLGDCIDGDIVSYKRTFSARKLVEWTKTKKIRHNLIFPEVLKALPKPKQLFKKEFVFKNPENSNKPYSNDNLNKIYHKALSMFNQKYNTELNISLYEATKHSFGTQLINKGVPENLLKKWFGHTKSEMTEKYAKLKVVNAFRNLQNIVEIHKKVGAVSKQSVDGSQS